MERVISTKDFEYYTHLRKIIIDLELADKEHWWLISDIEANPHKEKYQKLIYQQDYLLIKTSDLIKMLEEDDFQWIWAIFSVIPFGYTEEEILKHKLPHVQYIKEGGYNPYTDTPKLQHPLAEFELYAEDSSSMFLISDNEELLNRFKKSYPNFIVKYE
jgi:hypothetical protein